MKRYSIEKMIMLDFLTPQDQITLKYNKGDGFVEWDEKNTIWFVDNLDQRIETINMNGLINLYVRDGRLIEI